MKLLKILIKNETVLCVAFILAVLSALIDIRIGGISGLPGLPDDRAAVLSDDHCRRFSVDRNLCHARTFPVEGSGKRPRAFGDHGSALFFQQYGDNQ